METRHRIRTVAIILFAFVAVWPAFQSHGQTSALAPYKVRLVASDHLGAAQFTRAARMSDFLAADPSGWVDITPHESLKGWTRVAIPPDKALDPVNQWKLEEDRATLLCEGNHGHEWLRYDHELTNFFLHVEWRFEKDSEGRRAYNSGVFVRNDLEGRVWHQAQVGGAAYLFGQTLIHGQVSPMFKTPPPAVNPLHPIG